MNIACLAFRVLFRTITKYRLGVSDILGLVGIYFEAVGTASSIGCYCSVMMGYLLNSTQYRTSLVKAEA